MELQIKENNTALLLNSHREIKFIFIIRKYYCAYHLSKENARIVSMISAYSYNRPRRRLNCENVADVLDWGFLW